MRPNEAFSGKGHARHLCKKCAKLGTEELSYRQEVRNIDQLLGWDGLIRRKARKPFERYLSHPNPRVRTYAAQVAARDAREREERAREWRALEDESDRWEEEAFRSGQDQSLDEESNLWEEEASRSDEEQSFEESDIPF
ncbi:MAG TPA: hypothetical protein VMK12_13180 [Anaeromyxobacteraceae bacterium]|nr:hypothetical protein [Anaeromyxobacteraceae bacterium]